MKIVFASVAAVTATVAFSVGTATGTKAPKYLPGSAFLTAPHPKSPIRAARMRAVKTAPSPTIPISVLNGVVEEYCTDCHNEQLKVGNISLEGYDVAAAPTNLR